MTTIKNINGGRSMKRFAGCKTAAEMKTRLTPRETIGLYKYGERVQIEVRTVNGWGRMVIVATAEVELNERNEK